ncbi:hypothetical protein KC361_g96 [Hortaea werneckii]|nr:hypothetical protein KC361_g96 [Hortaea werneckii]
MSDELSTRFQHLIDWSSNFDWHVDVIDELGLRPCPVLDDEPEGSGNRCDRFRIAPASIAGFRRGNRGDCGVEF